MSAHAGLRQRTAAGHPGRRRYGIRSCCLSLGRGGRIEGGTSIGQLTLKPPRKYAVSVCFLKPGNQASQCIAQPVDLGQEGGEGDSGILQRLPVVAFWEQYAVQRVG